MKSSGYNYGAYINFAFGGQGSDPTNPIAQTGDLIAIIAAILAGFLVIGAGVFFAVKYKDCFKLQEIRSKTQTIAQAISSNKILIAMVIAISVIAIAAFSFGVKAFAESNPAQNYAAPPYVHTTATMDKYNGTVSVDTIHIDDQFCKENFKAAPIENFSIFTVNGFSASELGTWHVSIDGIDVYTGPAAASIPFGYYPKIVGAFDIDVSVEGISPTTFDMLNNRLCAQLVFTAKNLVDFEEVPDTIAASVSLYSNDGKNFTKGEGFSEYISFQGWDTTDGITYKKEFAPYSLFEDILEPWYYAYDTDLLTCNYDTEFFRWRCGDESGTKILLKEETFIPVWYPTQKDIPFTYYLKPGDTITTYGMQVINANGWTVSREGVGGDPQYCINGTISNCADISSVSGVLTADCFSLHDGLFGGWNYMSGVIFEIFSGYENITCEVQVVPEFVVINGKVVDANGAPKANVAVTFSDVSGKYVYNSNAQHSTSGEARTITDANGNYYLTYIKGTYGVLRFGTSPFDEEQIENTIVGQSFFINYYQEQSFPTVTVRQKVTLNIEEQRPDANGFTHLDYGEIKFVASDGKVFYGEYDSGHSTIDTFPHISGKVIYESAYYYGELSVPDTGEGTSETLYITIKPKSSDQSDCVVSGTVYVNDGQNNTPLANRKVWFKLRDITSSEDVYLSATTDDNGKYTLRAFQDLVLSQVAVFQNDDPSTEIQEYSWHYEEEVILSGLQFNLDIVFIRTTPPGDESSV